MEGNGKRDVMEWLRLVTPTLTAITLFIVGVMFQKIDKIEERIFSHMTNDEIHIVRGTIVNKSEFDLYQKFRDVQMLSIENKICEIKELIQFNLKNGGK